MQSDRISLIEFLDEQIKQTKAKIKKYRMDRDISHDLKKEGITYGTGRMDALKYVKSCLKDSAALDKEQ